MGKKLVSGIRSNEQNLEVENTYAMQSNYYSNSAVYAYTYILRNTKDIDSLNKGCISWTLRDTYTTLHVVTIPPFSTQNRLAFLILIIVVVFQGLTFC